MENKKEKVSLFNRFLNYTEWVGNALPHPATLFLIFAGLALLLSWIASLVGWSAVHPGTGEVITPVNLLSRDGIHKIILEMVKNFTGFAPLGVVLVAVLGLGVAESSGLIDSVIRLLVIKSPRKTLTFVLVLAGVLSNVAADVGYVLLIPLAGTVFLAIGRHPIIGMAAAFAGVSGGYSANLVIGSLDPLLAGLSQEAAGILAPGYQVNAMANYYFMIVSTFLIAILGTFVTEKIVAPRFKTYEGDVESEEIKSLNDKEKRGLWWAVITFCLIFGVVAIGIIPENGFLRGEGGSIIESPLIKGIIALIFITFALLGLAYGFAAGKFKNDADVISGMSANMKTMAVYIVLVFFAAQFVAYFKWSHLGEILAINGANVLKSMNVGTIPLILSFILLTCVVNMVMGSASAKWAIMAPIFIPLFMQLGYTPELTQVSYRIGDSVTNLISPMMSYFALIIAYFQKYDKNASIGTIISTMLPYTIIFLIGWAVLLIIWITLGLPLGPEAPLYYTP